MMFPRWIRRTGRAVFTTPRSRHSGTRRPGTLPLATPYAGSTIGLGYMARRADRPPMAQRRPSAPRRRTGAGHIIILGLVLACALGTLYLLHGDPTSAVHENSTHRHILSLPTVRPDIRRPVPAFVPVVSPGTTFSSGACLAFPPLHGNRHHTVFVDAGHGGPDSGTQGTTSGGTTVLEKNLTLASAHALLVLLQADGYRVVMSRISDTSVVRPSPADISQGTYTIAGDHADITARIACANAAHADVLVALHYDGFGDPTVGGVETIDDSARPFRGANQRLASLVQENVVHSLQAAGWNVPDRGVVDDSGGSTPGLTPQANAYVHLLELGPAAPGWLAQPSVMPGVLIEPLFVTDPTEADIAVSRAGQETIARGIAAGINAFFAP